MSTHLESLKAKLLAYKAEHDKARSLAMQLEEELLKAKTVAIRLEGAMTAVQELLQAAVQDGVKPEAPAPAAPAPPLPPLPGDIAPKAEG